MLIIFVTLLSGASAAVKFCTFSHFAFVCWWVEGALVRVVSSRMEVYRMNGVHVWD